MKTDEYGGTAIADGPAKDEFGGVAVASSNTQDEFGGVPVSDKSPDTELKPFPVVNAGSPNESFESYLQRNPTEDTLLIQRLARSVSTPEQQEQFGRLVAAKMSPELPVEGTAKQAWDAFWSGPKSAVDYVETERGIRANTLETDKALRDTAIKHGLDPDKYAVLPTKAQQVAGGIGDALVDTALTFVSPGGVLTGGMGALPKGAQKVLSYGFAAQMLSQVPGTALEVMKELAKPEDQRDYRRISQLVVGGLAQTGFGTLSLSHGLSLSGPEVLPSESKPQTVVSSFTGPEATTTPAAGPASILEVLAPKTAEALKETPKSEVANEPNNEPIQPIEKQAGQAEGSPQPAGAGGVDRPQEVGAGGNVPPVSSEPTAQEVKTELIKSRIPALKPDNVQITVAADPALPREGHYVQVDEVSPSEGNVFSSNPDQMNALGYKMPTTDELLRLPTGKYSLPDAIQRLQQPSGRVSDLPPEQQAKSKAANEEMAKQFSEQLQVGKPPAKAPRILRIMPGESGVQYEFRTRHFKETGEAIPKLPDKLDKAPQETPDEFYQRAKQYVETGKIVPPKPPTPEPGVREGAKEFDRLVLEYAPQAEWTSDLDKLLEPPIKSGEQLGTMGIKARILQSKEMANARAQAARDLGIDPGKIGQLKYRAEAVEKLRSYLEGKFPENKQALDFKKATQPGKGKIEVPSSEVSVGDTLIVKGESVKVKSIDPDTGDVELDGTKFGRQTLLDGTHIFADEWHKAAQNDAFLEESANETVPKLGAMEKGTGDLLKGQNEDFALVGEKGTDLERIAAEKAKAAQTAKEAKELEKKQQQVMTGMGGAALEEIQPGTALKNAVGELERASHGLPEAYPSQRRNMAEAWIQSGQTLADDPTAGQKLADELKWNPERGMTDDDSALLLRHKVALEHAKNQAAEDEFKAKTPEAKAEARNRFDSVSNQLLDLLDAAKFRGSQWGREGRWRQAIAFDDYSLETMRRDSQMAKGRELTTVEVEQIKALHDRIAELEKQLSAQEAKQKAEQLTLAGAESVEAAVGTAKSERVQEKADGTERDLAGEQQEIIDDLKERFAEQGDLLDANSSIQKLMELLARDGITERVPMEEAVHKILKEVDPEMTLQETQDLMSGYGKYKQLSKDPIKVVVRGIKGEIQQVRKLLDFFQGKAAAKTGVERRIPTDIERQWIKVVNQAKKAFHIEPVDPAKQLKSALDAINTRLTNRLRDLKQEVANRQKIVRTKTPSPYNNETLRLRSEIAEVKKAHDEIFGKPELTDAQRLALAEKSADRQIAELERQLQSGEIFPPGKEESSLTSAKLDAAKARIAALKQERDFARETIQPTQEPEVQKLQEILTRYRNLEARYADRLARKDFATRTRKPAPENADTRAAKARVEGAKLDWQRALLKDRMANRTVPQKLADLVSTWKRSAVLLWPTTFAKLFFAALEGLAVAPTESVTSALWTKILPKEVTEKSARYGGKLNLGAEHDAYVDTIVKLVDNFKSAAKTGNIEIDLAHGKKTALPDDMSGWIGNLHYAFKTPLMQNEWSRSFRILMDDANSKGVDTTEPAIVQRIGNEAYRYAEERLFMENNLVVDMYNRMLQRARQLDPETGQQTATGKAVETALRFTFPIVRIPTNLVKRAFEYAFGTGVGSVRLARAYWKGIENLPAKEADAIIRNFSRGTIGTGFLLYGFFNPQQFGGYYNENQKRQEGSPDYGSAKFGDVPIPKLLLHHPLLEMLQVGATMRRVADSYKRKHDQSPQGLSAGAWAALMGLTDEAPFTREIKDTIKSLADPSTFFGELGKSAIPGVVQWIASRTDTKPGTGNFFTADTTKRKPTNVIQHIETGIPGLRQNVPKK